MQDCLQYLPFWITSKCFAAFQLILYLSLSLYPRKGLPTLYSSSQNWLHIRNFGILWSGILIKWLTYLNFDFINMVSMLCIWHLADNSLLEIISFYMYPYILHKHLLWNKSNLLMCILYGVHDLIHTLKLTGLQHDKQKILLSSSGVFHSKCLNKVFLKHL